LHRGNGYMAVYHEAGCEAESKLRRYEPAPMDPRLELWMYDAESRVQNAGPEQRRQSSAEQNRTTREHWQCYSVQQTDQSGADNVNERRENKPCCVKRQDLLVGHR